MYPIHSYFKNKTVVITGGSGILCSEMARALSKQQANIVILNRTLEKGEKIADELRSLGGQSMALSVDILDKDSLLDARTQILDKFGAIHVLINGAGGNHPDAITFDEYFIENSKGNTFFDLDETGFKQVFDTNFLGTFLATQVFAEELLKVDQSSILNISSMSGYSPLTKVPAYSAAKSSINNFTQWLAVYFAGTSIRVNSIAPGFFLTDQNRALLTNEDGSHTDRAEKILSQTPLKEFGQPDDLIGAMLFLTDPHYSRFITGIIIPVDGGFLAYSGV
ncbi:SDR family oxidoreductase [Sporosarcina cascadiensis]|uniref:SDR family oxidoreductase n=1 Tax=Sporosarcina cascadiensis TaxID=2660747 RepID=UPI00129BB7DB|nr:SDR family oxidoreductase [Sporosarcina cascadiensis]